MAQMSNYLKQALIDHTFRAVQMATPGQVYVALYSDDPTSADTGTELLGSGYARQEAIMGVAVDGISTNTFEILFPAATADWVTITHIGIRSEATGGNLLMSKALTTPVTVLTTNNFRIPVGDLEITFA